MSIGFEQRERRGIFHHAARISRRELHVHDDGVVRVLGVDFAEKMPAEDFVLAGLAERLPAKRGRFPVLHHHPGDPRLHTTREDKDGDSRKTNPVQHKGHYKWKAVSKLPNGASDAPYGVRQKS